MRLYLTIVGGLLLTTLLNAQNVVSPSGTDRSSAASSSVEVFQPTSPKISIEEVEPGNDALESSLDPASLLPDLPRVPPGKATLIGGTVSRVDRVQDQLVLQVFGGGKMRILFDTRTHIYRDGMPASAVDLRPGDRVSVDTILDGSTVFARNIRLKGGAPVGESQGVVVSYRGEKGELVLRDALAPEPLKIRLSSATQIVRGNRTVPAAQLIPGALVTVKFGAEKDGRDIARQVSILAVPGDSFQFAGRVITLDLRAGLLVLTSDTDRKTYEIYLGPSGVPDNVQIGNDVTVSARLDGGHYVARGITVNSR